MPCKCTKSVCQYTVININLWTLADLWLFRSQFSILCHSGWFIFRRLPVSLDCTIDQLWAIWHHFSGNFRLKCFLKRVYKVKSRARKGKKGLRKVQKCRETVLMGSKFVQWSRRKIPENEPNQCKINNCAICQFLASFQSIFS